MYGVKMFFVHSISNFKPFSHTQLKTANPYQTRSFLQMQISSLKYKSYNKSFTTKITEVYMIANHINTLRTYYQDTYLSKQDAKVIDLGKDEKGDFVIFDRTLFHPKGGGQPDDEGYFEVNEMTLTVTKLDAPKDPHANPFQIKHYFDGSQTQINPIQVNTMALQVLDMNKRSLYARLHSAGHLLANAVQTLYPQLKGINGNHFPNQCSVVFTGFPLPNKDELKEKVIVYLNELIEQDLSVTNTWDAPVRTIQFGHLESYPCGGTHVTNTKKIGQMSIRSIKNEKGNLKIGYDVQQNIE